MESSIIRFGVLKNAIKYRIYLYKGLGLHVVFFISILFKSIIRLKPGKNKQNLSITKAQILPQDELKNGKN